MLYRVSDNTFLDSELARHKVNSEIALRLTPGDTVSAILFPLAGYVMVTDEWQHRATELGMSVKIASDGLEAALAPQTTRTQDTGRVANGGSATGKTGTATADSVEISSLSAGIAQAGAADNARVEARIAVLKTMYARGEYRPDSAQVSRALVDHALGGAIGDFQS
jgi:anti-sigma28 factor (negative regulator of flagellin synthesis)